MLCHSVATTATSAKSLDAKQRLVPDYFGPGNAMLAQNQDHYSCLINRYCCYQMVEAIAIIEVEGFDWLVGRLRYSSVKTNFEASMVRPDAAVDVLKARSEVGTDGEAVAATEAGFDVVDTRAAVADATGSAAAASDARVVVSKATADITRNTKARLCLLVRRRIRPIARGISTVTSDVVAIELIAAKPAIAAA